VQTNYTKIAQEMPPRNALIFALLTRQKSWLKRNAKFGRGTQEK